jgi:hypothetical protein
LQSQAVSAGASGRYKYNTFSNDYLGENDIKPLDAVISIFRIGIFCSVKSNKMA